MSEQQNFCGKKTEIAMSEETTPGVKEKEKCELCAETEDACRHDTKARQAREWVDRRNNLRMRSHVASFSTKESTKTQRTEKLLSQILTNTSISNRKTIQWVVNRTTDENTMNERGREKKRMYQCI